MSGEVDRLEQRLGELRQERDAVLAARTSESTAESAKLFLESARARAGRVGGHVVGVHAVGSALDDVLRAFLLSDPRLESFLVEEAQQFAQLSEKAKAAKLRKLDGEIAAAEAEFLKARKAEAIAAVEREFSPAA